MFSLLKVNTFNPSPGDGAQLESQSTETSETLADDGNKDEQIDSLKAELEKSERWRHEHEHEHELQTQNTGKGSIEEAMIKSCKRQIDDLSQKVAELEEGIRNKDMHLNASKQSLLDNKQRYEEHIAYLKKCHEMQQHGQHPQIAALDEELSKMQRKAQM